jgi:hypothetical protein
MLMRTSRGFTASIVFLLFRAIGVKANASFYSRHWHHASPNSAFYRDRITQSRASLALRRKRVSYLMSDSRKRQCLNSTPPRSFDRMKPPEKMVSGTVRVLADALEDYIVGFCIGITVGAGLEFPRVVLRSSGKRAGTELGARLLVWAHQTGEFFGCFRGCATAVRLVRSPKRDDWNLIYGCATAGAIINRNRK